MISIIISSFRPNLFSDLIENIKDTIGIDEYEIIKIDNPGIMGLCDAYNKGAADAKYKYLCFCHEDVLFHTQNWGELIISSFSKNPRIGIVGFAGSVYKTWIPSGWGTSTIGDVNINI